MTAKAKKPKENGQAATSNDAKGIVSTLAKKHAEEIADWAKRSVESNEYIGMSEPRF